MTRQRLRGDRVLLGLLAVSTLIKLVLAGIVDPFPSVLDERAYLHLARRLAGEGVFEGTFRPPLYPAYLAVFLKLGLGTLGARVVQVFLSTATVALVYSLTQRLFSQRAARIAAALVAFNPVLIAFSHRLWSETLYIFLFVVVLHLLFTGDLRDRWRWLAAGLCFGLAGLTRPMILTFAPLLLPWAIIAFAASQQTTWRNLRIWRHAVISIALFALTSLAVVLPWTARNARLSGALILVDTNAPFNLLVGSQTESAFVDKDDLWSEAFGRVDGKRYEDYVLDEPARAQDLAMEAALANITSNPGLFLRKSWWEAGHLWTLDSFLLRHVRNGWYGNQPVAVVALVTLVCALFLAGLIVTGFTGLAGDLPRAFRVLVLLLLIHSTLLFGLTYSLSRYGLPLQVVLAITAAVFLSDVRGGWARLRSGGRRAPAIVLVAALLFVGSAWLRDLPLLADMVSTGGAHHRFEMKRLSSPANIPQ